MTKTIRVGIIGAGSIARYAHVPGYKAQPNVEIVAAADTVPGKAAAFAAEFGIPRAYDSMEEMLSNEQLDAVSVCTPNYAHKAATIAALNAGLHVLCEKPIAMNLAEGREMVETARRLNKVLQADVDIPPGTDEDERGLRLSRALRDLLKSNKITTKDAVFCVPGHAVFQRPVKLPKTSPERLPTRLKCTLRDTVLPGANLNGKHRAKLARVAMARHSIRYMTDRARPSTVIVAWIAT